MIVDSDQRILGAADVLEIAREFFCVGVREDLPEAADIAPPTRGRDPMVKRGTDKAEFFTGGWRKTKPRDFRVYQGGRK